MSLSRISYLISLVASIVMLSSCAILSGGGSGEGSPKADDWDKVPKTYIDGLKAAKNGDSKQAIQLFKTTIETNPTFSPAYTNLGLQQLRLKDYKDAESSLKKSIELKPENPLCYQHLGVIYRLQGDFSDARDMYKKALIKTRIMPKHT